MTATLNESLDWLVKHPEADSVDATVVCLQTIIVSRDLDVVERIRVTKVSSDSDWGLIIMGHTFEMPPNSCEYEFAAPGYPNCASVYHPLAVYGVVSVQASGKVFRNDKRVRQAVDHGPFEVNGIKFKCGRDGLLEPFESK